MAAIMPSKTTVLSSVEGAILSEVFSFLQEKIVIVKTKSTNRFFIMFYVGLSKIMNSLDERQNEKSFVEDFGNMALVSNHIK